MVQANGMPDEFKLEIAFDSSHNAVGPAWVDCTDHLVSFNTRRGRTYEIDQCEPGTATFVLDATDGTFDFEYPLGPHHGKFRPMTQIRMSVVATKDDAGTLSLSGDGSLSFTGGSTSPTPTSRVYLFRGYIDSWRVEWPEGGSYALTTVTATDAFKQFARVVHTIERPEEGVPTRMKAILANGGSGMDSLAFYYSDALRVNEDNYAERSVVAFDYGEANLLDSLQELARSDGGALFIEGTGKLVFQSNRYRILNTRGTTPQAIFGNYEAADVLPMISDVSPSLDDSLIGNYVTITDGEGEVKLAQDATLIARDGRMDLDLGTCLLIPAHAQDRVNDLLLLRKDPFPRYEAISFNALTGSDLLAKALYCEIGDRIRTQIVTQNRTQGTLRDQNIESVEHSVDVSAGIPSWITTFGTTAEGATRGTLTQVVE